MMNEQTNEPFDFQGDKPNMFHTWVKNESGEIEYKFYHANHATSGDTDSCYMQLPESVTNLTQEEIVEIADEIGSLANSQFPEMMEHLFNVPHDRRETIATDREVVAKRGLFLTKKRYIMHVINNEGAPCDKLKIMGVELKKSDTSPAIKMMIRELVEMIIADAERVDVVNRIEEMRTEFKDRFSVFEIAKPISVKTLRKCEGIFEMTGSMKGFPYQVRAAMFYNNMCTKMDSRINAGDKMRLVYIKHPKSKYIGVPSDLEVLPDWWDDEIIIDYKTEWDKARKKIEAYMLAMGWDVRSVQKAATASTLGNLGIVMS